MTQAAGGAIALNYGFNWITGYRADYRELINTNNDYLDYTRVGFWLLGEGEMDGCEDLWDSGLQRMLFTSDTDDSTKFRFHPGFDATAGSGAVPTSAGGDQQVDQFWTWFPAGVQPLHYHRIAYYALFLKQVINDPPGSVHQNDPSVWADINPVGLWRGIRCRVFDATGAMTSYGFTTNPAWQMVDVLCRRKFFPEYALDAFNGAEDLPVSVKARFDWGAIAAAATAYDQIQPNGSRQYEGNFAFAQQTTLQAIMTQMLQCCRSYMRERAGRIGFYLDQRRPSVFTMSRMNADSFSVNDQSLHTAANKYVGKFRDILVPSAADIVSISAPDYGSPLVTTLNPHPFAKGDRVIIGGTGTKYDGLWLVASVPTTSSTDTSETTLTLMSKGSNYPTTVGAGGKMGITYSRFKDRAPEFNHHAHQYARGAIGVGIPRQRNKVKLETDFTNSTFDQVSRISRYMQYRALGQDVAPYVPPVFGEVTLPLFAFDAAGEPGTANLAIGIEPGDRVTVDSTLDVQYAGDYEVLTAKHDYTASEPSSSTSMQRSPSPGSAVLTLGPYSDAAFADATDVTTAGWDIVPDSQPGNSAQYTQIDLADGVAVFFSGTIADGQTIDLPSIGLNQQNVMSWVSPQGYIEANGQMHNIVTCDVDSTRLVHMIYGGPSGATWHGDLNYACLAWRTVSSAAMLSAGENTFVELTLSGGEKICFGHGHAAASAAVTLPAGYTMAQAIMIALPLTAPDSGNLAHGFRAQVTSDGIAHHDYKDGSGNSWEGDTRPFVFAWKNNMGTVVVNTFQTPGGFSQSGWIMFPLASGKTLSVAGYSIQDARFTGTLDVPPASTQSQYSGVITPPPLQGFTTLQTLPCANGFQIVDHPAHGQNECFVTADNALLTSFQDGEGNIWYGSSSVFLLVCEMAKAKVHPQ